jgi:signal transduction histidine kinase
MAREIRRLLSNDSGSPPGSVSEGDAVPRAGPPDASAEAFGPSVVGGDPPPVPQPPPIHKDAYAAVLGWISSARDGGAAPLVIDGPSGVGKTHLWRSAAAAAGGGSQIALYGKAGQADERPYGVVTQLLAAHPDEVAAILSDGDWPAAVRAFVIAIAPSLASHLSALPTTDYGGLTDPAEDLTRLLSHLALRHCGRRRTALICIDDYQWTDRYSRKVLHRLMERSVPVGVALLTRDRAPHRSDPAGDGLPVSPLVVPLRALTREETREFVDVAIASEELPSDEMLDRLYDLSAGIPLAIASLLRSEMREDSLEGDVLVAIAGRHLSRLPGTAQVFLRVVALVGSAVSLDRLRRAGFSSPREIEASVAMAERARLVYRDRSSDLIRFSHDSVESAVRLSGENDPESRRVALELLLTDARSGNSSAAYAAARLLGRFSADTTVSDWALVYAAASGEALKSLAPLEATSLAETGLVRATGRDRVRLYAICHEAAYLAADREMMSRYYRRIVREGDASDVAEARYLWVRSCYADARFVGALSTGVRILSNLPAIGDSFEWSGDTHRSRDFLFRHGPRSLLRAIRKRGRCTDPSVVRAADTLGRMLLPSMTIAREKMAHVARFTLQLALEYGWTASTGSGFIAWALHRAGERDAGPWVRPYVESAEAIAVESGDPVAIHSLRMLSTAFGLHWYAPYPRFIARMAQLAEGGRREGNWEYVAHCIHLHDQALLYRGAPLPTVLDALQTSRQEIQQFGLPRIDNALAKFHQATEVLAGLTADPVRLDGRILNEEEYHQSIVDSDDRISMAGFRIARGMIAFFADRPDLVVEELTLIDEVLPSIMLFHDLSVIPFYLGVSAYRVGRTAVGDRTRATLRRLARVVPDPYRHRSLFVDAESETWRGHRGRARRLLTRAARLAEARGYLSDAAMIHERRGDLDGNAAAWRAAEVLYLEWGARHAVARVRAKRGASAVTPLPWRSRFTETPLAGALMEAVSLRAGVETLAREIGGSTGLSEMTVLLRDVSADTEERLVILAGDTAPSWSDQPAPDVRLILGQLRSGESRIVSSEELHRPPVPALAVRTHPIGGTECRVLVVGHPKTGPYSGETLGEVAKAVVAAAPALALAAIRSRLDADETALQDARRQLDRTEKYRRDLFATVSDAFLLMDRAGDVVFSNPAAARYLIDSGVGMPRLQPEILDAVASIVSTDPDDSGLGQLRLAGEERSVQVRVAPVESAERASLIAVSIYDVTEAVERETRLAQQERRLVVADRLAAIGTFSAAIAHEISNPNHILQLNTQSLSVVLSWIAAESDDDPTVAPMVAQARELLVQVEDAAQRIEAVLQLVKSYGREGRNEKWGDVDLNEIASRAFRFSRIMAAQYSDHVRLLTEPEPVVVRGEPALLEQAIVNLIRNACEALPDRNGRVELHVTRREGAGIVSICDTGKGFPQELRERLATPFATGRAESGGTGLGLSIVAGIVEKHGGVLTVDGEGTPYSTRVSLSIPTRGQEG